MSKRYEICSANCGHQFPNNSTNSKTSAKGQTKKAEAKLKSTEKQQPNKYKKCKKVSYEGNNENHDHIAIASKEHQNPTPKEEQEISFNTGNLVTIWNYKTSVWNSNSETANVVALAKRMGLSLSHDDILDMDVYRENQNSFVYEVYFCSKHVKEAFLEKSHILKEFPETKSIVIY